MPFFNQLTGIHLPKKAFDRTCITDQFRNAELNTKIYGLKNDYFFINKIDDFSSSIGENEAFTESINSYYDNFDQLDFC